MENTKMFNAIQEVLKTAGVVETEATITLFSNARQLGKSFNEVILQKGVEYETCSDEAKLLRNNLWDAYHFETKYKKIFEAYGFCEEDIDTTVAENYIDSITL